MSYQPPNQPQYPEQPPNTYYPPQQPMQQPPAPKKKRRWPLVLLGAVLLCCAILGIIIAASGGGSPTTSTSPTATTAPTRDASTPAPTPKPTQAPKWTTVQSFTGSGIKKTGTFSVPDDWRLTWTCKPSSFYGGQYNVQVYVYNSDGSIADVAINDMCKAGNTSGETEEHQAGSVYLQINSEGVWSISVLALK